jgi:oligosaccharide translocation protein RFT1
MGELQTDARVKAEGAAIVCKTLVTFLILLYDSRLGHVQGEYSLMAFAIGQLVYGTCILGLYMYHYGSATLLRAITSLSLKTKCVSTLSQAERLLMQHP